MAGKNGGNRPGAGRKKGAKNKATKEIKELAQPYAEEAIMVLAKIMKKGETSASRVSAAKEILDRAYGKAPQALTDPDGEKIEGIQFLVLKP